MVIALVGLGAVAALRLGRSEHAAIHDDTDGDDTDGDDTDGDDTDGDDTDAVSRAP